MFRPTPALQATTILAADSANSAFEQTHALNDTTGGSGGGSEASVGMAATPQAKIA